VVDVEPSDVEDSHCLEHRCASVASDLQRGDDGRIAALALERLRDRGTENRSRADLDGRVVGGARRRTERVGEADALPHLDRPVPRGEVVGACRAAGDCGVDWQLRRVDDERCQFCLEHRGNRRHLGAVERVVAREGAVEDPVLSCCGQDAFDRVDVT
jgi:hypothetical protein